MADRLILGKESIYEPDEYHNKNILVVGPSGCGKSRSVIMPSLLENTGSMVIVDPKGALYREFKKYFQGKYKVYMMDLCNPENSTYGFNPLIDIRSEQDILSLANMIICADAAYKNNSKVDPFWQYTAQQVLQILLELIVVCEEKQNVNLASLNKYLDILNDEASAMGILTGIKKDSMAYQLYEKLSYCRAAEKTMASIYATLISFIGNWSCEEIQKFFRKEALDITRFAEEPSILFIKISDCDESNYMLATIILNYYMDKLYKYCDKQKVGMSNIPIRFIMEDYSSSIIIHNLPRYTSTARARGVCFTIVVQSLSQLEYAHGENAKTLLTNMDYWVIFSSTDYVTCKELLSNRLDIPIDEALSFPLDKVAVFVRGRTPQVTQRYDIEDHENYIWLQLANGKKLKQEYIKEEFC